MKTLDKKKQKALMTNVLVYVVLSIAFSLTVVSFVLPEMELIDTQVSEINALHASITNMEAKGISADEFKSNALKRGYKVQDSKQLEEVLRVPEKFQGKFLNWITEESNNIESLNRELEANRKIIGAILPVFTTSSLLGASGDGDLTNKDHLTLRKFIEFVEVDLLAKHNLESSSSVGIDKITFGSGASTKNIGKFELPLDLKGSNEDLLQLLEDIEHSGKLTIRQGKLIDPKSIIAEESSATPVATDSTVSDGGMGGAEVSTEESDFAFDNLLMSIEDATFRLPPFARLPSNTKNSMALKLAFYIRGVGYDDFVLLRGKIEAHRNTLSKSIEAVAQTCTKDPGNQLCQSGESLDTIARIKTFKRDLDGMKEQVDRLKTINPTSDMTVAFEALFPVSSSLTVIDKSFELAKLELYPEKKAEMEKKKREMLEKTASGATSDRTENDPSDTTGSGSGTTPVELPTSGSGTATAWSGSASNPFTSNE